MRAATPNTVLRELVTEAGWAGAQLTREVNRRVGEAGLMPRLDRGAPSNWLTGRLSRPEFGGDLDVSWVCGVGDREVIAVTDVT